MSENDDLSEVNHEDGEQQSNIHLSDVIAAIKNTDPSFEAAVQQCGTEMFNGGSMPGPSRQAQPSQQQQHQQYLQTRQNAYVKIIQQPAQKSLRFRYECEGRSAGAIPGANSTSEVKTYPTIEICGYKGRAVVVVSCVTKDAPYRAHPHNLVGKDGCKKGVCTVQVNPDNMCVSFSNLGIQCVKRRDIENALKVREEIRVDPFRMGFAHRNQPTSIDLNAVRLCFQVFLPENDKFTYPLKPVVSDIIYDKKAMSDLVICKLSHCSASVAGGQEIILLCEKVAKDDISIKFCDDPNDPSSWVGLGDFQHADVHKQVAITFRSPRYKTLEVDQPVKVYIQLMRNSDSTTSEALPFEMLPLDSDPVESKRKRLKGGGSHSIDYLSKLQPPMQDLASADPIIVKQQQHYLNILSPEQTIKREPRDQPSSPYGGAGGGGAQPIVHYPGMHRAVIQGTPSPQPYNPPPTGRSPDYGSEGWAAANVPLLYHQQQQQVTMEQRPYMSNLIDMDAHRQQQQQFHENIPNVPANNNYHQWNFGVGSASADVQPPVGAAVPSSTSRNVGDSSAMDVNAGAQQHVMNSSEIIALFDPEHENMTDSFGRLSTKIINDLTEQYK